MKRYAAIICGIIVLTFVSVLALAGSSLDMATPQNDAQRQEPSADQAGVNALSAPDKTSLSKRNKAKLELENQKQLRQEQIGKEKTGEAVQQQQ